MSRINLKSAVNKISEAYKSDGVLRIEWLFIGIVVYISFFVFRYYDLNTLTVFSVNILDLAYEGRLRDFYAYSVFMDIEMVFNAPVGWDISAICPWAIWNIPIWIAQRFFGVDIMTSIPSMIWSKLFLFAALFVTSWYTFKIGLMITGSKSKSNWMTALTLTSAYTFFGVYYAGQNDIVAVAFAVIAVSMLFEHKTGLFLLFSACSIATKPLFFPAFVAIILLHEKRIPQAVLKIVSGFGILFLFKLLYHNAPFYKGSQGLVGKEISNLLSVGIDNSIVGFFSFFLIGILVIFYICYTKKSEEEIELRKTTIYMIAAVYILMFVFGTHVWYRHVFLIPFVPMVLCLNDKTIKINMILYPVINVLTILQFCRSDAVSTMIFRIRVIYHELITAIFPKIVYVHDENIGFKTVIEQIIPEYIFPVFSSVILFGYLLLLVINYPGYPKKVPFENQKCERVIMWCNLFTIVPFIIGILVLYLHTIQNALY
ncbi:MAG: hypothetical protein FWF94_04720 [Oscillospiraceae bacterium]|nr:hypothetical protein [Oscillospiraceae bacterium]